MLDRRQLVLVGILYGVKGILVALLDRKCGLLGFFLDFVDRLLHLIPCFAAFFDGTGCNGFIQLFLQSFCFFIESAELLFLLLANILEIL